MDTRFEMRSLIKQYLEIGISVYLSSSESRHWANCCHINSGIREEKQIHCNTVFNTLFCKFFIEGILWGKYCLEKRNQFSYHISTSQKIKNAEKMVICNLDVIIINVHIALLGCYSSLLYGPVSQGLRTTKFTNLIGWNRYWPWSRFSHLDWHLDW